MEITLLQNPTCVFDLTPVVRIRSFWTWGPLLLAVLAAFGSLIRKARIVASRLRKRINSLPELEIAFSYNDSDNEDDTSSCCSSEEGDMSEEDNMTDGDSVVDDGEGWMHGLRDADELKPELDLMGLISSGDVVKIWDKDRAQRNDPVFVTCNGDRDLAVWDARMSSTTPAMFATWQKLVVRRRAVGLWASRGDEKVLYVAAEGGPAAAVDLRAARSGTNVVAAMGWGGGSGSSWTTWSPRNWVSSGG